MAEAMKFSLLSSKEDMFKNAIENILQVHCVSTVTIVPTCAVEAITNTIIIVFLPSDIILVHVGELIRICS